MKLKDLLQVMHNEEVLKISIDRSFELRSEKEKRLIGEKLTKIEWLDFLKNCDEVLNLEIKEVMSCNNCKLRYTYTTITLY